MNQMLVKAYSEKLSAATGRPVSPREAESEILDVVMRVARNLSRSLQFGYHTHEDMEHEGVVQALEILEKGVYDVSRPLENFLHVHLHNRLHNLKRKHFFRSEPPCSCCDAFGSPENPCSRWTSWKRMNASKQNLMRPVDVSSVSDEGERNMSRIGSMEDESASREILGKVERGLPAGLRSDYLRMRGGVSIPKVRRQRVRDAVLEIVGTDLE